MVGDMGDLKLRVWLSAEAEGPDLLVVRCLQQRFRTFVVLFDLTPGDADLHGARSDHEETKREWSRGPFYFFVTPIVRRGLTYAGVSRLTSRAGLPSA